jgi:diaminohydroxyphosphoribosylaminopyrimidine deaminase/5-amino-6-(5-phosphoribosylamino)uracil reductase
MTTQEALMRHAIAMAETARMVARPNPWVGAVLVCADGQQFTGSTSAPGGAHAEVVAISAAHNAGASTVGATLYSTLEPCSHTGRTGPCTEAIVAAGISELVTGITDPDTNVSGRGLSALRGAGVNVTVGVCADEINEQLAPYLYHRTSGRAFVVLKLATTIDACTTIPTGPRWITGEQARIRVHQLRAESDAIVVGAETVRTDDPELTVRHVNGPSPRRIVLSRSGNIPTDAKVHPCELWSGGLHELAESLGNQGVIQLMVEGGSDVASQFHAAGLVNRYIFHVAPIICGNPDARPVFAGEAPNSLIEHGISPLTIARLVSTQALGNDLELIYEPLLSDSTQLSTQKAGTP